MRLFVQPRLGYALTALLVSFIGAVAISATVYRNSSLSLDEAIMWPSLVAAANGLTMAFNAWTARRNIRDQELARLTIIKSVCNMLQGIAWGLSVPILNIAGEPVTVIAPAWAMVTGVGILVFSSAPWPPGTYSFITALFLPAVVFLLGHDGALERLVGITMAVCFPFCLVIGRLGARYVGDLVEARLEVDALLKRESQLSARLKQLNEERNRFFSAASHDLRQPLQALSFYTNLVGLAPGQAEQRDLLARLAECADTLERQFNAILGVASTDAAIEVATPRPIALEPIMRRAAAGYLAEAEQRGLNLRIVSTRAIAMAVPDVLERVLSNLIGNAVRYTRKGGVVVGVRPQGGMLRVMVADSGIGVAAEYQTRIFEDFFQVSNPERNSAKGFGLGLAIVKRLADGMNWSLALTSRPGHGSVFSVGLPRAHEAMSSSSTFEQEAPDLSEFASLPVLILDDDGLVRDAMARLLRDWRIEHDVFASHEELLVALRAHADRPCCILLDYRLGGQLTGIDVIDEVRSLYGDDHRFLLITGEADEALTAAAEARKTIILRKPIKPIRLRAVLSSVASAAPV